MERRDRQSGFMLDIERCMQARGVYKDTGLYTRGVLSAIEKNNHNLNELIFNFSHKNGVVSPAIVELGASDGFMVTPEDIKIITFPDSVIKDTINKYIDITGQGQDLDDKLQFENEMMKFRISEIWPEYIAWAERYSYNIQRIKSVKSRKFEEQLHFRKEYLSGAFLYGMVYCELIENRGFKTVKEI